MSTKCVNIFLMLLLICTIFVIFSPTNCLFAHSLHKIHPKMHSHLLSQHSHKSHSIHTLQFIHHLLNQIGTKPHLTKSHAQCTLQYIYKLYGAYGARFSRLALDFCFSSLFQSSNPISIHDFSTFCTSIPHFHFHLKHTNCA